MARIKKFFSNAGQVLHLWANQSQSDARSRNVFFDGPRVYSYGRHYELGRLIKYKGKTVALINSSGYSVTTSKHISWARSAVSHLIALDCPDGVMKVKHALKVQRAALVKDMEAHFKGLKFYSGSTWKAMQRSGWGLPSYVAEYNASCTALKESGLKIKVTAAYVKKYDAHVKARMKRQAELAAFALTPEGIAKAAKAQAKRDAKKTAEQLAKQAEREAREAEWALKRAEREAEQARTLPERIQRFREGQGNRVEGLDYEIIRVKGNTVQTSQGAEVPLDAALRLYKAIEAGQAQHGDRVGGFSLEAVIGSDDNTEVRIGCHTILLSEARMVLGPLAGGASSHLKLVPEVASG